MPIAPIDLTSIIAVIMGISIVLVPVIGLTARFALKPTVEALIHLFEKRGHDETVALLERRLELMEKQMESLDATLNRFAEVQDFHRELSSGGPPATGESVPATAPEVAGEGEGS